MDLSPLKIDRAAPAAPANPRAPRTARRGSRWTGPLVVVALLGAALWLFHRPLRARLDRVRLPEVEVAIARRPTPAAIASASGTAANGYIVARTRAALSADTPGRIVELNVKEGDAVKKGFVVARLFSDEYRAALARASADVKAQQTTIARIGRELAAAKSDIERLAASATAAGAAVDEVAATRKQAAQKLARAEKMVGEDVESRQWLDDARAEDARAAAALANAEANRSAAQLGVEQSRRHAEMTDAMVAEATAQVPVLEAIEAQARATFEKTEVKAPFDGVVVLKDAEVGEVVSPNSQGGSSRGSVATMVDFASLEVQVEMPEKSITAVRAGAPARIFLDAFPDHGYAGTVTRIWPVANRQKASIEVRVTFDAPDAALRPEMGARVVFLAGRDSASAQAPTNVAPTPVDGVEIPAKAVVRIGGATSVFVLERDRVRLVAVTAGEEQSGHRFVERGLAEDDRVVVDPPPTLADGDRVRVKEDA